MSSVAAPMAFSRINHLRFQPWQRAIVRALERLESPQQPVSWAEGTLIKFYRGIFKPLVLYFSAFSSPKWVVAIPTGHDLPGIAAARSLSASFNWVSGSYFIQQENSVISDKI